MKRTLSLALAAALAAGTMVMGAAPAAAQGVGVTFGVGNWDNDGWHDDNRRYGRHYGHHRHHVAPGFSFNFGVPASGAYYRPYYRDRDCWRDWDGALVCRY